MTEVGDRLTHECEDMPVVLAGGASGRLLQDRYLTLPGESHGRLYTSICRALGLDTYSFGDESHGVGGVEGVFLEG